MIQDRLSFIEVAEIAASRAALAAIADTVYLSTEEAAAFMASIGYPIAASSLVTIRCRRSDGPPYHKAGRAVSYQVGELRRWVDSQRTRT